MLSAMVAIVLGGLGVVRSQRGSGVPRYGREASRDRLLVVDRQAGRLTVYDAINGRPLRHLDGDAAAEMLQRHDSRVFVIAADGMRDEAASP